MVTGHTGLRMEDDETSKIAKYTKGLSMNAIQQAVRWEQQHWHREMYEVGGLLRDNAFMGRFDLAAGMSRMD